MIRSLLSTTTTLITRKMQIIPIPCLQDNYAYLVLPTTSKDPVKSGPAIVIDPVEAHKVQSQLPPGQTIQAILTTHHHWDHAGGNADMKTLFPNAEVWGGDERILAIDRKVQDGQVLTVEKLKITALSTPCHTSGHVCYLVEEEGGGGEKAVFTGDTLFIAGCGKFFEGTASQMVQAMEYLASLGDDVAVYCGHEYTKSNLKVNSPPLLSMLKGILYSLPLVLIPTMNY